MMNNDLETNSRLAFFQSFVGQSLANGPSPLGRWLNGTLLDVQIGHIKVKFTVREDMTNPMGSLHGGAAAAIMDDVVGVMVFMLGREFAYTSINLNCDFLSNAKTGEVIIADAQIVRAGKNVIHCECRLVNEEGKIVAKTATNLIQTGVRLPM